MDSTLIKTAQISAIVTAAAASGGIISISLFTIPALVTKRTPTATNPPTTTTRLNVPISYIALQWQNAYDLGKKLFPSMAITSSLLYSFAAYTLGNGRGATARQVSLLYTAAALNVMIAPFTFMAILPVNNAIAPHVNEKEEVQSEQVEQEFVGHLEHWSLLNAIRGLFPLAGAGLGAAVSFGLLA